MRLNPAALRAAAILLAASTAPSFSQVITKSGTGTDLTAGASWGGAAPGATNVATWTSTSLGSGLTLGSAASWQGINIGGSLTDIGITGAGLLTLGTSGITIATTTNTNLDLNITFGSTSSINVASTKNLYLGRGGRTLTFGAGTTTTLTGAGTVTIGGSGSTSIAGSGNLTINSGATYRNYMQGGNSTSYSGTTTLNAGGIIYTQTSLDSFGGSSASFVINGGTIGSDSGNGSRLVAGSAATTIAGNFTVANTGGSGSTITFGSAGSLMNLANGVRQVTANAATVFAGTISNGAGAAAGGLTKLGTANLTLSSSVNSFTGQVTLTGGSLTVNKLANAGSVSSLGTGAAAASLVFNGGTLNYTGTTTDTTDRAIDMRSGAAINNNSAGAGALSFTAANVIQGGTASARTLTLGGTNAASTNTLGSALGNSGIGANITSLVKNGAGIWVLSGASTYSGSTSIQGGTLSVASLNSVTGGAASSNLGAPVAVATGTIAIGSTTTAATLRYTGAGETTDRVINLAGTTGGATLDQSGTGLLKFSSALTATGSGAKTLVLQGSTAGSGELAGNIVDSAAATSVTKQGTGTWILSGPSSSHTGVTTVAAGTLQLGSSAALGSTAAGTSVTGGAVLDLGGQSIGTEALTLNGTGISSGGALINSSGNAATYSGAITLGSAASIGGSGNTTILGAIGGGFALTKVGAGTVTLGTANTHTGGTIVSAGLLSVTGSIGAVSVSSGADLGGTGTVGAVDLAHNAELVAGVNGLGSLTTGNVTLAAAATGNLVISGLSNYTGAAAFTLGDLSFGAGSALKVKASGFSIGTGFKLFTYTGTNAALVEGSNLILEHTGLGRLQVALDLATANEVKYNVTGAKNYWTGALGADWQDSGQANWAIAAATDTDIFLQGDLVVFGAGQGNRAVNLAGDVSPGSIEVEGADDYSFSSTGNFGILGTGSLSKTGAGKLTINTANDFSGGATLQSGRTVLGSDTALGTGTLILSGGTLSSSGSAARNLANAVILGGDVALGHADDLGSITFSGATFGLGGATRTLTLATGAEVVVSGIVSDGGLVVDGAGTLILTGSNTYSGGTTIQGGVLQVGNNGGTGTLGSGAVSVASGATLAFNRASGANQVTASLSGSGDITKSGAGEMSITGTNTMTGSLNVSGGKFAFDGVNSSGDFSSVTVASGAKISLGSAYSSTTNPTGFVLLRNLSGAGTVDAEWGGSNDSRNLRLESASGTTFSGVLADGVTSRVLVVRKTGAGTLVLTGANTHTGATTVAEGTLQIGDGGATGDIGTVSTSAVTTIESGATLRFYRSGAPNYNSSARLRVLAGAGTFILEGTGANGSLIMTVNPASASNSTDYAAADSWSNFSGSIVIKGGAELQTLRNGATALGTGIITLGDATSSGTISQYNGNWSWTNDIVLVGSDNALRNRSTGSGRAMRFFGVISGSGNVTFDDFGGAMTDVDKGYMLLGDNTMSGNIIINTYLRVGGANIQDGTTLNNSFGAGSTGSLGTGDVTINSGKIVAFTRSNAHSVSNDISGAGKVHIGSVSSAVNAAGGNTYTQELTLTGSNTYSGGTELLRGTLIVSDLSATGNIGSGYLAVKGGTAAEQTGTFRYTGASVSTSRALWADAGRATFDITQAGTTVAFTDTSGSIGGGSGNLITKTGLGTLEIADTITAGGSTALAVSQGRLRLTAANTGAISTTIAADSTLEIGGSGTLTAAPVAANGTLHINSSASFTLGGALTGSGSLTKSNNGILTIGSANANFGGSATVNGGKLVLGNANALGGRGITVASGGTLDLGGLAVTSAVTLAGGTLEQFGAYTGTLATSGSNTLNGTLATTFVNSGTTTTTTGLTFTGTLKGTGTLAGDVTVSGAHNPGNSPGLQTIDGNLTYSGGASTVQWELITATNAANQAGVAYDQIVVTGNVAFDGATALTLVFNGTGSDVNWTDAFWNAARSWLVYDVGGSLTSFGNLTITGSTLTDDGVMAVSSVQDSTGATLASARADAGFYLGNVGSDVRLFYRPVPEPSTYGLILGALALAGAAVRRRKRA